MKVELELPSWAIDQQAKLPESIPDLESRMRTVIEFARSNVRHATGGPFAAGVFEKESGKVIAFGVNLVVPASCSAAHAEIVALSFAQKKLGSFDLGAEGMPDHQLVVNGRPCAMCFGAIPWSGVRSVVSAASGVEIEEITGFDEGPIHPSWAKELKDRGIEVIEGVLREEACAALQEFAESGQQVYNGRGK